MAAENPTQNRTGNVAHTRSFAVVTGASTGIGFHLAREFATHGFDVLIAADESRIHDAARELETLGARAYPVQADLSKPEEVERLWKEVQATGRDIDAIALNAGIGASGDFSTETDLDRELRMIDLNVRSTVHLAKLAARRMAERGQGRILITASIAGTMPTPYMAVYGATKAFDLEFAQSLRYELKDQGVTVTALKPGATDTEFFRRADMEDTQVGSEGKSANDPADVARQGFEALMAGEQEVFASSLGTKVAGTLGRFMPDSVKASQHEKMAQHGTAKK
ncbi:SDR family NAD(P)-dependent oxidoreductase [Acidobacteria bacterium AB60]|nr:SDR family NAD(P)-dependent oxidoreductase [Acidobacteria bacterium AB60]